MNWYLVDPKEVSNIEEKKKDGEKRNYLKKKEIFSLDLDISKEFKKIVSQKKRNILSFTSRTHLRDLIKFYNKKITVINREAWFRKSLEFFKNNEIVFLDPDNGLLKEKTKKNSLKHLYVDEIKKYLSIEKVIIFTQFQSYNKNHKTYLKEIKKFLKINNLEISLPIIRNRTAPNTFFITLGNKKTSIESKLLNLYNGYVEENKGKLELVTV